MRYAVLLRGVNVGKIQIKSADLRETVEAQGFEHVKTILASGNVLVDSGDAPTEIKATFEAALRKRFGYEAWVLVYPLDVLREIADAYPFDAGDAGKQPYVVFVEGGGVTEELAAVGELDPAVEQLRLGPHGVLFWEVTKGETLHSTFGKASSKARYKSTTTTRNLRTVKKLLS